MKDSRSVLIVDGSPDARAVLRAALERGGTATVEACQVDEALRLTDAGLPDLIVLDLDSDASPGHQAARQLGALARRTRTPIVVIGTAHRDATLLPHDRFVAKPYHYGPLVRRIEELLGEIRHQ